MAYNTTPFHGKKARIEKNDVVIEYSVDWTINVALDLAEINRQGQDWKEHLPGMAGWTGSMNFHLVAGNTEQKALIDNIITATPGTKLTDIKFLLDASTNAFTGNIYLNGFAVNTSVGDKVGCSFNFTGDGALSITDAA